MLEIFEKGGPVMWPLLFTSITALATVLERLGFLVLEARRRQPDVVVRFFHHAEQGDWTLAVEATRNTTDFVARTLGEGLRHRAESLTDALLRAANRELRRFGRGLTILDTTITLAPLLGLLGTVTGMIGAFGLIGDQALEAPAVITGGIAEALIATAFGLAIAITALIPFNYLNGRLEEARHELQDAATQLELLVRRSREPAVREA
jgi:biopolymer transport protein ExbB